MLDAKSARREAAISLGRLWPRLATDFAEALDQRQTLGEGQLVLARRPHVIRRRGDLLTLVQRGEGGGRESRIHVHEAAAAAARRNQTVNVTRLVMEALLFN